METHIEIYKTSKGTEVHLTLNENTIWLNAHQIAALFDVQRPAIVKHINNIYKAQELRKKSTCSNLEQVAADGKKRKMNLYNLDIIISVGYRVNSKKATQFRQWATIRLKEYLIDGYAINKQRLAQKQQEVQYLKTGIRILGRAIETNIQSKDNQLLKIFAKGLELLDDYDHETLDSRGISNKKVKYPTEEEYLAMINEMYSDFESDVFAKPKDKSFSSSIHQIQQTFDSKDLYPSIEVKAANLLYFIVKNHSFVDGNKRIAAACFLYFLERNDLLFFDGSPIISNEALVTLTLFVAVSNPEESELIVNLITSILNRKMNRII